jgi:L-threonylcarbamoyladenylate synthase
MRTRVLAVDPVAPAAAALADAAATLRAGGLVAFPTETYYGLGAAALHAPAVRRVFDVKGRPESRPLLVLVDGEDMVDRVTTDAPAAARALMARHWPGPLTLVLRARPSVPVEITAGTGTIGVRLSPHPVARGLVQALGAPVTAPSANRTDGEPATTAGDVLAYFDGAIELVLDGGTTPGGLASTVVDATVDPPVTLRAGPVRV